MLGLTVQTAKNIAIASIAVLVVAAIVMIKVAASTTKKVVVLVALAAVGAAVWSQRQSLDDCADTVQLDGGVVRATCSFFGQDVVVEESV